MRRLRIFLTLLGFQVILVGCALQAQPKSQAQTVSLPLHLAWYDGREVQYVTTDVSDKAAAAEEGANFAPRLSAALHAPSAKSIIERVYKVSNFPQRTVFQSAPTPVGANSTSASYSPVWRMVLVTWKNPAQAVELRSEEAILAAEEAGKLTISVTDLILNCPVVSVEGAGTLVGVHR